MIILPAFSLHDPATTEIYPLSLHDALPICAGHPAIGDCAQPAQREEQRPNEWSRPAFRQWTAEPCGADEAKPGAVVARSKSTRLNSSHVSISYAVFCLKKKNKYTSNTDMIL